MYFYHPLKECRRAAASTEVEKRAAIEKSRKTKQNTLTANTNVITDPNPAPVTSRLPVATSNLTREKCHVQLNGLPGSDLYIKNGSLALEKPAELADALMEAHNSELNHDTDLISQQSSAFLSTQTNTKPSLRTPASKK